MLSTELGSERTGPRSKFLPAWSCTFPASVPLGPAPPASWPLGPLQVQTTPCSRGGSPWWRATLQAAQAAAAAAWQWLPNTHYKRKTRLAFTKSCLWINNHQLWNNHNLLKYNHLFIPIFFFYCPADYVLWQDKYTVLLLRSLTHVDQR